MTNELSAEFIGTFTLVTAVCGAALFSAPQVGFIAVAFAVGLSVLTMAYAVGGISGGHFNPAVTLGLVAAGRFDAGKSAGYIVAQVLGGLAAAAIFYIILKGGAPAGAKLNTFEAASNVAGTATTWSILSAGLIEVVITALFLIIIVSVTSPGAPAGFAPIAIGLALVLFHLVAIPVSNASLNPARSTATAVLALTENTTAIKALWLFWVAPIVGGVIGGYIGKCLQAK